MKGRPVAFCVITKVLPRQAPDRPGAAARRRRAISTPVPPRPMTWGTMPPDSGVGAMLLKDTSPFARRVAPYVCPLPFGFTNEISANY